MEKQKAYHVTSLSVLRKIRTEGLKGYHFNSEELARSFTPLKAGRISKGGWVFCYPDLETAQWAIECGMFGPDATILEVEGEGLSYWHQEDSETQVAILAKGATWKKL